MKNKFLLVGLVFSTQVFSQICDNESVLTAYDARYDVDLADQSIVTDLATGLVWRRCPEGFTFNDQGTTETTEDDSCDIPTELIDQDEDNDDDEVAQIGWNWLESFERAEEEGNEWRLPNVKELVSLVEHACYSPAINTDTFPFFFTATSFTVTDDDDVESLAFLLSSAASSSVWSSTPDVNTDSSVWTVSYSDGSNSSTSKFSTLILRLVRDQ